MWGIIAALSLALLGLCSVVFHSGTRSATQKKTPFKSLTTGASRVNPQELWVHDLSARLEIQLKRLDALEQSLEQLLKLNAPTKKGAVPSTTVGSVKQEIAQLFQENMLLQPLEPSQALPQSVNPLASSHQAVSTQTPLDFTASLSKPTFKSRALQKITLSLKQNPKAHMLKSTDNHIPAGAFAEAVLMGGVDASTAIQASSDPRPILLRLTHPGTLPRRFQSDLEGCHALAASYGDISSERVFMRLEKLSCVERKTGEVMEMAVQGYVAGEDGRAGIRGVVVDKAGASMRNAMIGGFFSSLGKFLGQNKSPLLFSPTMGLGQQNPMNNIDMVKQSAGTGMGSALDKYADFYIKRAEQMQPVIQVAAGRKVDIVFSQGLEFSDSVLRKMLSKSHDQTRLQQVQQFEEIKPLQSWLPPSEGAQK